MIMGQGGMRETPERSWRATEADSCQPAPRRGGSRWVTVFLCKGIVPLQSFTGKMSESEKGPFRAQIRRGLPMEKLRGDLFLSSGGGQ